MIDPHRYRQALEFAHAAEGEIKRLKRELAEALEAATSMKIIAEGALDALESCGKGYA